MRSASHTAEGRLAPQDRDAEATVLGGCLSATLDEAQGFSTQLLHVLLALRPEDFWQQQHQDIFRAVRDVFDEQRPVSPITVAGRLREENKLEACGGNEYLNVLANGYGVIPSQVRDGVRVVAAKARLREMLSWTSDVREMIYAREHEPDQVIADVATQALRFAERSSGPSAAKLTYTEATDWATIETALTQDFDVTPARFGVGELDHYTGGLGNMFLVLLLAMQGSGKTRFALHSTLTTAQRFLREPEDERPHVLVFPLEEGRVPWVRNAVGWLAGIDSMRLMPGRARKSERETLRQKAEQAHRRLLELPVVIGENVSTASQITTLIQIEARRRRLGLVVIDYLQRLGRTAEEERRALAEVSLDLQSVSEKLGVPILLLSQMSFSETSGTVLPYGGRGPAFDASLAISLTRKESDDGRKLDEGTIKCEKARPIPEFGPVQFHVDYGNGGHYYDTREWAEAQARGHVTGSRLEVRDHEHYGNR